MNYKNLEDLKDLPAQGMLGTSKVLVQVLVDPDGLGHMKSSGPKKTACQLLKSGAMAYTEVWTLEQVLVDFCPYCLKAENLNLAAADKTGVGSIEVEVLVAERNTLKEAILALQESLGLDGWETYKTLMNFSKVSAKDRLVNFSGSKAWGSTKDIQKAINWKVREDPRVQSILEGLVGRFRATDPFVYSDELKAGEPGFPFYPHPELYEAKKGQKSKADISTRFIMDLYGLQNAQVDSMLLLYGIGKTLILAPSSVIDYLATRIPATEGTAIKVDIDECGPQALEALGVLYDPSGNSGVYGSLKTAYEAALVL